MLSLELLGIYLTAILAVMTFSCFLYKDNPFFHIAEHAAIGVALGNAAIVSLKSIYDVALTPAIKGQNTAFWAVGVFFCALILVRWPRRHAWVSRWPLAVIVGAGIGLGFRGAVDGQLRGQILGTIMPVFTTTTTTTSAIDNLLMIMITIPVIAYFIFSSRLSIAKGPLSIVPRWARYAMMLTFGAQFGNVMLTKWAYLAARIMAILAAFGFR